MARRTRLAAPALAALCSLALGAVPASAAPGDLDATFAGGIFTASFITTFPGSEDSQGVAADSQGRVYLSATEESSLSGNSPVAIKVVRLSPQGVPDAGYGSGGVVTLPTTGNVRHAGIAVDAQDRPVILGYTNATTANPEILLTRLTTAGIPDATYGGGDGVVTTGLTGTSGARPEGLGLTADGQALVAGTAFPPGIKTGFITRFTSAGAFDTSYGTGGWTQVGDSGVEGVAIHVLAGGAAFVAGYDDYREWLVAKLTAGGALDMSFDGDGIARTNLGIGTLDLVSAYGMTADSQGRPLVTGQFTPNNANVRMTVMRWTAAGAPDTTFGDGTPVPGARFIEAASARGTDLAVQCFDGKILAVGIGSRPPPANSNGVVLARLLENGTLDTGFAAAAPTPGIAIYGSGDNNVSQDLLLTSAGAYVAGMRTLNQSMVYTIYPQVARIAAAGDCSGTPPPEPPPVIPPAAPPTTAAPPAKPAAAALPLFSRLVTLPSTRRCVSRRKFSIRLKVPAGSNVVQATVNVDGKRAAVRRGARLRSTVDLRNLPKGRFKVEVVLKLRDGRTVRDNRRYKTCAPKKRR